MTSKLKCPFCQTKLEQMHDKKLLGCSKCLHIADGAFWAKAIQSQKDLEESQQATLENAQTVLEIHKDLETAKADIEDYKKYKALWEQIQNNTILELERKLEIARKALDWIGNNRLAENPVRVEQLRRHARNALEEINRKED